MDLKRVLLVLGGLGVVIYLWFIAFNPRIKPGDKLTDTNLSGKNLREVDFGDVSIINVDFSNADLSGANFDGAWFFGDINFSGANLNNTNFNGADFDDANVNLSGANLSGANLSGVNLQDSKLTGANLNGANLFKTNLLGVEGLTDDMLKSTAVGGSLWLVANQDELAKVCQGKGITQATAFSKESGFHPIILVSLSDGYPLDKSFKLPDSWYPEEIYHVELVACTEVEEVLLETCTYELVSDIQKVRRIRFDQRIQLVEAKTGKTIATEVLVAEAPRACGQTELADVKSITREVESGQIADWLSSYVHRVIAK